MYHLQELFLTVFPTLDEIKKMGLVPRPDEIVEFSEEMYQMYEATYRKYGKVERPLFTIKTEEKRMCGKAERLTVLKAEQVEFLERSIEILGEYAETKGIDTDDRVAFFKFLKKGFSSMQMLREIDAVIEGYRTIEEYEEEILSKEEGHFTQ